MSSSSTSTAKLWAEKQRAVDANRLLCQFRVDGQRKLQQRCCWEEKTRQDFIEAETRRRFKQAVDKSSLQRRHHLIDDLKEEQTRLADELTNQNQENRLHKTNQSAVDNFDEEAKKEEEEDRLKFVESKLLQQFRNNSHEFRQTKSQTIARRIAADQQCQILTNAVNTRLEFELNTRLNQGHIGLRLDAFKQPDNLEKDKPLD